MKLNLPNASFAVCVVCWWSILPTGQAADPADQLTTVHSQKGNFTISLPGTVKQLSLPPPGKSAILHEYLLVSRLPSTNTLFVATKFVYRDAAVARAAYQAITASPPAGFTKVSQQPIKQAGLQGQDTKIRSDKGQGYGYSRMLLDGDSVYTLVVESLPGRDGAIQEPMHTFFDSFALDPHRR